jgi:uncharacterized protein YdhG (YjbR/CyaY superfamily)
MQARKLRAGTGMLDNRGKTVTAYLAALPKKSRTALQKLRKDIRAVAPEAVELIAWGMPAFKQGRLLVGYAAFRDHCSLFPMSVAVMRRYAAELEKYVTTKGSIHFSVEKPLPTILVKKLVRARIAENKTRQALRSQR